MGHLKENDTSHLLNLLIPQPKASSTLAEDAFRC